MKVMFLDESGDHNLEIIDSQYPIFVLGGAIFDARYHRNEARPKIRQFKHDQFGTDRIILHTADIYRNRNGYEQIKDPELRQKFYRALNQLIASLDFEIIASAILKKKHLARYGIAAVDPYLLSLEFLVERFVFALDSSDQKGTIVAESRNPQLDNQLNLAWLDLKIKGTRFLSPTRLIKRIQDFRIIPKSEAVGGLEVADLIVSPIGRALLGKQTKEDFLIIKKKFRRNQSGHILGHGLIVFPIQHKTGPATQSPFLQ